MSELGFVDPERILELIVRPNVEAFKGDPASHYLAYNALQSLESVVHCLADFHLRHGLDPFTPTERQMSGAFAHQSPAYARVRDMAGVMRVGMLARFSVRHNSNKGSAARSALLFEADDITKPVLDDVLATFEFILNRWADFQMQSENEHS
jgi:hypothetical protein